MERFPQAAYQVRASQPLQCRFPLLGGKLDRCRHSFGGLHHLRLCGFYGEKDSPQVPLEQFECKPGFFCRPLDEPTPLRVSHQINLIEVEPIRARRAEDPHAQPDFELIAPERLFQPRHAVFPVFQCEEPGSIFRLQLRHDHSRRGWLRAFLTHQPPLGWFALRAALRAVYVRSRRSLPFISRFFPS